MIKVWILMGFLGTSQHSASSHGGPIIIDNIASHTECVRMYQHMKDLESHFSAKCVEVWKVK